jgi:hypothetical protein
MLDQSLTCAVYSQVGLLDPDINSTIAAVFCEDILIKRDSLALFASIEVVDESVVSILTDVNTGTFTRSDIFSTAWP